LLGTYLKGCFTSKNFTYKPGSQHFGLSQSIAQSLAGRCGILVLLPPSLEELSAFPSAPANLFPLLRQGAYPRIYDRGIPAHQWLFDSGPEIDLLVEHGEELDLVEIKSGATTNSDFFKNLKRFSDRMKGAVKKRPLRSHVVYGGDDSQKRSDAQVLSWRHIQRLSLET